MKVANHNKKNTAVIAFSPGEYFAPVKTKDWLTDFDKLIYVASTQREHPFITELVKDIPAQLITHYQIPVDGQQGAPALWNSNASASETWMSLVMFIKKVKEEKYR